MRRFGEGSGVLSWGFRARALGTSPRARAWVCSGLAAVALHGLAWQLAAVAGMSAPVGLDGARERPAARAAPSAGAVAVTVIAPVARAAPPRPAMDGGNAAPRLAMNGVGPTAAPSPAGASARPSRPSAPTAVAAAAATAPPPAAAAPPGTPLDRPLEMPADKRADKQVETQAETQPETLPSPPDEPPPATAPTAAALAALPRYATDLPPAFRWPLVGWRNGAPVSGHWVFDRSAGDGGETRFDSQLVLTQGGKPWLRWDSQGPVRSHGLQPERFEDSRRGRRAAAALDHALGQASFSGRQARADISPLAQDRLSWMLQLIAAVRADPALQRPGAELRVQVLGAQGASMIWVVRGQGPVVLQRPERPERGPPADSASPTLTAPTRPTASPTQALLFVREPESPYDSRVSVWLDPSDGMALLRLRVVQVPGGAVWDLWRPTLEAGAGATM